MHYLMYCSWALIGKDNRRATSCLWGGRKAEARDHTFKKKKKASIKTETTKDGFLLPPPFHQNPFYIYNTHSHSRQAGHVASRRAGMAAASCVGVTIGAKALRSRSDTGFESSVNRAPPTWRRGPRFVLRGGSRSRSILFKIG